jgi:hypothetical protein
LLYTITLSTRKLNFKIKTINSENFVGPKTNDVIILIIQWEYGEILGIADLKFKCYKKDLFQLQVILEVLIS